MFYGWAIKFIFGTIGVGFTAMLAVQIYTGNLTPAKNKIVQSLSVNENLTEEEAKKRKQAYFFTKGFLHFLLWGSCFIAMVGWALSFVPAIMDIPYLKNNDYAYFEGEIIRNSGSGITISNEQTQEDFSISTRKKVGTQIAVHYLPYTKEAEETSCGKKNHLNNEKFKTLEFIPYVVGLLVGLFLFTLYELKGKK